MMELGPGLRFWERRWKGQAALSVDGRRRRACGAAVTGRLAWGGGCCRETGRLGRTGACIVGWARAGDDIM